MRTKRIAAVTVLGTALALVLGIAYGAIGSGGTISGCYVTKTGALRVIDASAGEKCKASEQPINWSVEGPKGDTGAKGDQGEPGGSGLVLVYGVGTRPFWGERITIQPGESGAAQNYCSAPFEMVSTPDGFITKGDAVLGGGWEVNASPGSGQPAVYQVQYSRPFSGTDPNGNGRYWFWEVRVENRGTGPIELATSATCGHLD